jgi:type VI secretion system secreted protein VgrG
MAGEINAVTFVFESKALGGAITKVDHAHLEEALDECFIASIELALFDPEADATTLLGQDCVLLIDRGSQTRRVCGLVRSVHELARLPDADHQRIRVDVAPGLALLELRRNTRMFQEKTVPEILETVLADGLGPYGRSAQLELSATYPRREYCMQYQESDLAFVERLMREEGISYSFDHAGDPEVVVLRDANTAYAGVIAGTDSIPFLRGNREFADQEYVHAFEREHRHTTTSVALRDFDWTSGTIVVEDAKQASDALGRDRESYEHGLGRSVTLWDYAQAAKRYQERDTPRQKDVRHEAHVVHGLVGRGSGNVVGFTPGTTFDLSGHDTIGLDAKYLITRVVHASTPASLHGLGAADPYHNRFECIPLETPHRPAREPARKPRIPGVQTAVVTGPSGEEIHTDEHGRVKVRFHWDRENPADDTSSCWVRCEQAWSGAGWGFWWVPRIGMEVVVQFVDGDPDRPLVTGCVYDTANALPYPQPDEKTKSTIKSNSSPGGGGSNELRFEDKAGSEEIYAHAQKDYNEVVENDHTTTVHNDQTNEVDGNQTQTIHGNQTERVDGNQTMSVGGARTVHVEGNFDETVDGTETRQVAGAVTETFDADETRDVSAAVTEDIGGSETRTIGADQTETINAAHSLTISGSSTVTITGSLTQTVSGGVTLNTPGSLDITAIGGMTILSPGGSKWVATGGMQIIAPGGVTFIDQGNNWMGGDFIKCEAYAELLCGLKIEIGIGVMEAFGAKVEIYPVFISTETLNKKELAMTVGTAALNAAANGTKLHTDLFHHEG